MLVLPRNNPQNKVDDDRRRKRQSQDCWSEPVVKPTNTGGSASSTSSPDPACSPVEDRERIHHSGHGDQCEETGADLANLVTEVQQTDCQTAEDDAEVEPGEECSFIGEEDFGLDSDGEGDPLA